MVPLLPLLLGSALGSPARPSILFLFADEMDGRIFDPASPQLKPPMPNLRKLGESGALFTTAYNQSPQCVPSRSALLVGLRTDQIEVWDNYHGLAATNGDASTPDPHCVSNLAREANRSKAWARAECVAVARAQRAPPTFIDRLAASGYSATLFGKMHAGGGLERFPGEIDEFPFSWLGDSREWTRGRALRPRPEPPAPCPPISCAAAYAAGGLCSRAVGPSVNLKGVSTGDNSQTKWAVPDNVTRPASSRDYAIGRRGLRLGARWRAGSSCTRRRPRSCTARSCRRTPSSPRAAPSAA